MSWGYFLAFLVMLAATVGYAWFIRHEARTGKVYFLFWPIERWSRNHHPVLFQMRQIIGWVFVILFAVVAVSFLVQFLGLVHG